MQSVFSQPPRPLAFPFSHKSRNIVAYFGGSGHTFPTGAVIAPRKVYRKPNKFRDGYEVPQEFSALHAGLKVLGLSVANGSASLDENPRSINWDVLT